MCVGGLTGGSDGRGGREIALGVVHVVEVVGVEGECVGGDGLSDMGVGIAGGLEGGEVGVADKAAFLVNGEGELGEGGELGVGHGAAAGLDGLLLGEADHGADGGVGGDAIVAVVGLADGELDDFAFLGGEGGGVERTGDGGRRGNWPFP